jgi:hypothetical protein
VKLNTWSLDPKQSSLICAHANAGTCSRYLTEDTEGSAVEPQRLPGCDTFQSNGTKIIKDLSSLFKPSGIWTVQTIWPQSPIIWPLFIEGIMRGPVWFSEGRAIYMA